MSAREIEEFSEYLRYCTDAQVQGVLDKEERAGRAEFAALARAEARRRAMPPLLTRRLRDTT